MSENMEREKNQRLRLTQEIEEEKMKHELMVIGMYEAGMSYNEMKSFLEAINQSKHPSSASNNKNIQKESHSGKECLSEITSDANGSQQVALQEANVEVSRSSYSYRLNHTSPTMHEHKTRYSNSPESPSFFEIRNKRKSSDSDETQLSENVNSTHSTNRYSLSAKSGSALRECQNVTEKRGAQDTQLESLDRKLERWRMNPLNVSINEKDVPLRQPNRPQAQERVPFRYCKEAHTTEQRNQVMQAVSQHLKEMAELWYTWQPATYSIFQWGSPIQVGTANGSLDRKPLTDPKAEQIKADCTYRNNYERACKRKASSLIAQLSKEKSSTEDESDDASSFLHTKKKKIHCGNRMSNTECAANQHAHSSSHEKAAISHQGPSNDDNNDPKNTRRKRKTAEEKERLSPELDTYPRRIIPPTPKSRLSLSRHRKENAVSKLSQQQNPITDKTVEQIKGQQKNKAMTSEEIRKEIEWPSSGEDSAVAKNVETRPLSIPANIQIRLSKTETSVSLSRITEKNDRLQGKELGLKLYEQQKKKVNLSRTESRNGIWNDDSSDDDEKKSSKRMQAPNVRNGDHSDNVSTSSSNINCPICNKLFPHNEIENHAANCEQFNTDNESNDNNQLNQLECEICNNYKTCKMAEFEEHVEQCIDKKKNKMYSRESDVSTSSFCAFKPISENQKDSEIDYLGQFSSNSKTKIPNGKKRKR